MWVVKLGGSLQFSEQLPMWLSEIAEHGGGKVVIVPGGGAFADQVRRAQQYWHFDDLVAHHMALLAMEQYGLMMQAMDQRLEVSDSTQGIMSILKAGKVAIWLPTRMVMQDREITPGWDITADSLAAWLARTLQAQRLVLVKSVELGAGAHPVSDLIQRGLLDRAFNRMTDGLECEISWLSLDQYTDLKAVFDGNRSLPVRLVVDNDLATA